MPSAAAPTGVGRKTLEEAEEPALASGLDAWAERPRASAVTTGAEGRDGGGASTSGAPAVVLPRPPPRRSAQETYTQVLPLRQLPPLLRLPRGGVPRGPPHPALSPRVVRGETMRGHRMQRGTRQPLHRRPVQTRVDARHRHRRGPHQQAQEKLERLRRSASRGGATEADASVETAREDAPDAPPTTTTADGDDAPPPPQSPSPPENVAPGSKAPPPTAPSDPSSALADAGPRWAGCRSGRADLDPSGLWASPRRESGHRR